ncbi:MAG: hypothetical protein ABSF63_05115 [Candidatus Bathyarchaeia archaeon]
MSTLISPEEIFQLHLKIRWTSFSTESGRIAFSQMRPGLTSYTSEREDRAFMEFGPQLMTGIAERLSPTGGAGKVQSLIVNLEKDSVLLTPLRGGYLAISADRTDAAEVFKEVEPMIRRL